MKIRVDSHIDAMKILRERGLGDSRQAAKIMASEVKRLSDPYVPFAQGTLKNTAQVVTTGSGVALLYPQPYAKRQYHGDYHHTDPLRGKAWDKRMMADKGQQLIESVAKIVGGKRK